MIQANCLNCCGGIAGVISATGNIQNCYNNGTLVLEKGNQLRRNRRIYKNRWKL